MGVNKYCCALFDIDGTLVDSSWAHGLAWHLAFKEFGFDVSAEATNEDIGMGGMEIVQRHIGKELVDKLGKQIADFQLLLFQNEFISKIAPFPYASELVHCLAKRGINVLLASSAPREVIEKFIDLLAVREDLVYYVSGCEVAHGKPAPDIFLKALSDYCYKSNCLAKNRIVVIGDSPYDIEAAIKAGLQAIAVLNNGFSKEHLKGAKHIFSTIKELYENVDALFIDNKLKCPIK